MHGKHPDLGNSVWRRVWKDSRASLNLKKKKEKKTVNEQQQQSTMYIYVLFFFYMRHPRSLYFHSLVVMIGRELRKNTREICGCHTVWKGREEGWGGLRIPTQRLSLFCLQGGGFSTALEAAIRLCRGQFFFFSSSLSTALTYSSRFSVQTQTLMLDHLIQKKLFKPLCCGRLAFFFFPRRSFLLFFPLFLHCLTFLFSHSLVVLSFRWCWTNLFFFLNAFLLAFMLISPPVTHIAFKRLALSPLCGKARKKKKVTRKHTSVDRIF